MCGQYAERVNKRGENLKAAFVLIVGQCSDAAVPTWSAISCSKDVLGFVAAIEALMFTFETWSERIRRDRWRHRRRKS
jgi:hypothetical protein